MYSVAVVKLFFIAPRMTDTQNAQSQAEVRSVSRRVKIVLVFFSRSLCTVKGVMWDGG